MDSVDVSLNRGLATLRLAPDNRVTIQMIREAVRDNGFTPKAAEVTVSGLIAARDGRLILEAGEQVLELGVGERRGIGAALSQAAGRRARLEGTVPETPRTGAGPERLEVRSVQPDEPDPG